ncbi:MAG: protein kinase domain-containing protein, partial [Actinomycetota bacterium]
MAHLSRGRRLDACDVWSTEREARCIAKTIIPERATERRAVERLVTEANILLSMTHPNFVRAYELLEAGDHARPVLVLETLTGETLGHLIDRVGPLTVPDVCLLGLHLCSAVGYLHRLGWLHLDLKPDNIVQEGGRAKVLDLSIAH